MSLLNKIQVKLKILRDLIYLETEKNNYLLAFNRREKDGHFKVYSPELFDPRSTIQAYSYIARGTIVSDCEIGKFTSIGPNCTLGYGQHPTNWVSTSPVFYSSEKIIETLSADKSYFKAERERISIGNDVWIGAQVYIKNGVTIGDGAIIAAGAVVVNEVKPYSIVGGVPAKLIKMRFSEDIIDELLSIKWWNKDIEHLKKLRHYFVSDDINAFINAVKKNEL